MGKREPMRRGRGKLDVDWGQLREVWEKVPQGKGLIGGDPRRRARWKRPLPPEPAPFFRYGHSSRAQEERFLAFLTAAPLEVEIGAGNGQFILDWAQQHPHRHFVAFEVRWKHAKRIFEKAQRLGLSNLWVSDSDARLVIAELFPDASVEVFHILMPDPWWKPKHQARRIISPWFVEVLARKLKPGGILRVETDVEGYPEFVERVVTAHPLFASHDPALGERFAQAAPTARQAWCLEKGHPIYRRYFRRQADPPRKG